MTDLLTAIPVVDLGASAALLVVVFMVLTGRLTPRAHLDDARADATYWRDAYLERTDQANELMRQNSRLIESSELGAHALDEIKALAVVKGGAGSD